MNLELHYKIVIKNKKIIEKTSLKKSIVKNMIFILLFELIHHKYSKGKIIKLYFSIFPQKSKAKLIYLKSTSDVTFSELLFATNYFETICKRHEVNEIETTIINPYISRSIMSRFNWVYKGRKKIIGKRYIKKIF